MAENKKSIIVYADWIDKFEELEDDEAGRLIKHFFRYVNDKNPEYPDRTTKLMFIDIKNTLKRDLDKWEGKSPQRIEKARIAGLASAEARKLKKELNSTNELQVELNPTKSTVSVTVSDTVNDINKVVIGEKTPKLPKSNKEELFNDRKESFRKDVAVYLKEYSKETLRSFFDYWTEPNPSKTKMRWELQKTFDVNLRLKNWTKNEKTFTNKPKTNLL